MRIALEPFFTKDISSKITIFNYYFLNILKIYLCNADTKFLFFFIFGI